MWRKHRVYFVTEKACTDARKSTYTADQKYDIIEKVYGFESEPKLI